MNRMEILNDYYHKNKEYLRSKQKSDSIEYITTLHFMNLLIESNSKILDACAGNGFYSFHLAEQGNIVVAGDITEENIVYIQEKQKKSNLLNDVCFCDATNLSEYENDSFDVVLNMGAYYHCLDKNSRIKSITECARVLKPGGLLFVTYLNKYYNIVKNLDYIHENIDIINKIQSDGYYDESSVFYQSSPDEIINDIGSNLKIIKNIATDGPKKFLAAQINNFNDVEFKNYINYHLSICEIPSLLGYSEHGLIICKKI